MSAGSGEPSVRGLADSIAQQVSMKLVFALFCLPFLVGCKETIMHDLDESGANQVVLALSGSGIDAQKKREGEGWSVRVSSSSASKALLSLEKTRTFSKLKWKPQAFKASLISGREEKKAMIEAMKTSRLEESIKSFPSVLEAYVHIFQTEARPGIFKKTLPNSSASVLIISDEPDTVNSEQIRKLVAGASGIKIPSIEVIVERAFIPQKVQQKNTTGVKVVEKNFTEQYIKGFSLPEISPLNISLLAAALLLMTWLGKNRKEMVPQDDSQEEDSDSLSTVKTKASTMTSSQKGKLGPWDVFIKREEGNESGNYKVT